MVLLTQYTECGQRVLAVSLILKKLSKNNFTRIMLFLKKKSYLNLPTLYINTKQINKFLERRTGLVQRGPCAQAVKMYTLQIIIFISVCAFFFLFGTNTSV